MSVITPPSPEFGNPSAAQERLTVARTPEQRQGVAHHLLQYAPPLVRSLLGRAGVGAAPSSPAVEVPGALDRPQSVEEVRLSPSPDRPILCTGSDRQMGYAQGHALRDAIAEVIDVCSQERNFRVDQPRGVPNWVFDESVSWTLGSWFADHLRRDAPGMHQRLLGMAEGAGLRLNRVYLMHALEPAVSSARGRTEVPPFLACSAVAVRGRASTTGGTIIARNFDYFPVVQPYQILRESRPRDGLRSLDFTVATMAGTIDGMNEGGLCITYNYAYTCEEMRPSVPISMVIAETLAACSTVEEAVRRVSSHPRWGGGILMLADASGDIASLELSNTRSHVRRPRHGEDVLFHTNTYSSPEMRAVEVSRGAVFSHRAHTALRGRRVLESPERRSARLTELLAPTKPLGPDDLTRILADHGPDGMPDSNTPCVHGKARRTTASLQFFPKDRRMRVASTSPCHVQSGEAQYTELGL